MSGQKPLILAVNVVVQGAVRKVIRFPPQTTVLESLQLIATKCNISGADLDKRYALYHPGGNNGAGQWLLASERFIHSYGMADQDMVELRRAPQPIYVTHDPTGQATSGDAAPAEAPVQLLVAYDDIPASEALLQICRHFNIKDPSQYSLLAPGRAGGETISLMHPLSDQIVPYGSKIVLSKKSKGPVWKAITRKSSMAGPSRPRSKPNKTNKPPSGGSKAPPSAPTTKRGNVFGLPLARAITSNRRPGPIPNIIEDCIDYLRSKALDSEGIFRLSGSLVEIENLKKRYDDGEAVDLSSISDPNIVSGVMKLYFRELPQPLLTFELYDEFLALADRDGIKDPGVLVPLVDKLPQANKVVLTQLTQFLFEVSQHADQNRMTISNLALVFGPNLLRSNSGDVLKIVEHSPIINQITADIIKHNEFIFSHIRLPADRRRASVWADGVAQLGGAAASSSGGGGEEVICTVKVAFPYEAKAPGEMSLSVGDLVAVYEQDDSGWWYGSVGGATGLFPITFCVLDEEEDEYWEGEYDEGEYEGYGYGEGEGEGEGEGYGYAEGEGYDAGYYEGEGEGYDEGGDYAEAGYNAEQVSAKPPAALAAAAQALAAQAAVKVAQRQSSFTSASPIKPSAGAAPPTGVLLGARSGPLSKSDSSPSFASSDASPPPKTTSPPPTAAATTPASTSSAPVRPAPARPPPIALLRTNSVSRMSSMSAAPIEAPPEEDTRDINVRLAEEINKRRDLERRFLLLEASLERLQARVTELESKQT